MTLTICCDLKTKKECYVCDGLVFIPYDDKIEKIHPHLDEK